MWLGQGRSSAVDRSLSKRWLRVVTLAMAVITLVACQTGPESDNSVLSPSHGATNDDSTPLSTDGASTVDGDETSTARLSSNCSIPDGLPYVGGPEVELIGLGEVDGVRVEGALYPHPDYEGNPWSQWGQGLVLDDGRFLSAIGDHHGVDGNSYVYEYDPARGVLSMIGDVLSYVDHERGAWGYGKIHGQIVAGPCGEAYLSTYWGTFREIEFSDTYAGDVLMRIDPFERTISTLGVPIDEHGQASIAAAPSMGLLYGEAVDPLLKPDGIDEGPFFVYDMVDEEVLFEGLEDHVGYRNVMVDADGRAYVAIGGGELGVYDPETNDTTTHNERLPGDWLRASTQPAPDGRVFGVTREPDRFFVMSPSGGIEDLGEAAGYTASMALSGDGESFYYMPGAHGVAWKSGSPLIRVDGATGDQKVVVELNRLSEEGLGLTVGGTYDVAVSPDGKTVYLGANASPLGDDSGFGEVVLLAVHLP